MRLSEYNAEWVTLRQAWIKWNETCRPEDKIDWLEFYEEHRE